MESHSQTCKVENASTALQASAVQGISGAAAINEQPDGVIQIYATTAVYLIRLFNFLHDQYTAAIDDSSVCIAKNDSIYKCCLL